MTIGSKIREIESKIENFKFEENINSVKAKIRDEMNNAILKDKYLSVEDAKLIRNYIEKIKKNLITKDILKKYTFLLPLYNDWKSLQKLIDVLDKQLKKIKVVANFLIIDDCSSIIRDIKFKSKKKYKINKNFKIKKIWGAKSYICWFKIFV